MWYVEEGVPLPSLAQRIGCVLLSVVGLKCATREATPAAERPKVEAHIVGFDFYKGIKESAVYPRVTISFTNNDSALVKVMRYRLLWTKGEKEVEPLDLVIRPGEQRSVEVIIYPGSGASSPTEKDTTIQWTATRHE